MTIIFQRWLSTLVPVASRKAASMSRTLSPAGVHFDGELFEFRRATRQSRAHTRFERLGAIGGLRHAVLDRAFGGAQAPAPVAIAIAGA